MVKVSIGEIYDFVAHKKMTMEFWGSTLEYQNQFRAYCQKIGTLIMEWQGVNPQQALSLPKDTIVPEDVHAIFVDMKNWVSENEKVEKSCVQKEE